MKKFLKKILIYISALLIIVLGINALYLRVERKLDLYHLGDLSGAVPDNIQICNFGSSHGQGDFNYTDWQEKYTCFNFALAAQSYLYDYKIMQNYKNKIQKGALVFIPVSYFSFFGVPETQEPGFVSKNSRYYKFLTPKFIEQYDLISDIFINYFPALIPDNIRMFVESLYAPDESFFQNGTDGSSAKGRYLDHVVYGKIDKNGRRIYNHEAIETLCKMIEELKERDVRVVLITTPFLRDYNECIKDNDPEFFTEFYAIINNIVRKTGVEYFDFSHDERYTNDYKIFVDADHLNKKGAKVFTNNLLKRFMKKMALGQEYIAGLEIALKKILPARISQIEYGNAWVALKISTEKFILLSWTSGASGACLADVAEINALKEFSPSRPPVSEALKSRFSHGSVINSARQLNRDRILEFELVRRISAGVSLKYFLVLEITEPSANLILLDESRKIEEAAVHQTPDINSFRTILPGHVYAAPPEFEGIEINHKTGTLNFTDLMNIKGISRPLAKLIQAHWYEHEPLSWKSAFLSSLYDENVNCLLIKKNNYLTRFNFDFSPEALSLGCDILQASRHGVLLPLLKKGREKILRTITAKLTRYTKSKQRHRDGLLKQLKECQEAEILCKKGQAVLAHIHEIPKRAEKIKLTDWDGNELEIILDPNLTPAANAEKYFKRYKKAKGNPAEIQAKLDYVNASIKEISEQSALLEAINSPEDFYRAFKDLSDWIEPDKNNTKTKSKNKNQPPFLNILKDGVNILVGLSARGNRHVTFKLAAQNDIWLHSHDIPGAHVIIKGAGRTELETSKREILEFAASLAASHSAGKNSLSLQIDYTERKYIRPVPGTVALVTYTNPGTLRVSPLKDDG